MLHTDILKQAATIARAQRSTPRAVWLLFALIACTPVLMALLTWAPDGHFDATLYLTRFFAPPVLLIEMFAVGLALKLGFRPGAAILALPKPFPLVAACLFAIVMGSAVAAPDPATAILRSAITTLHALFGLAVVHIARLLRLPDHVMISRLLVGGSIAYCFAIIALVLAIDGPSGYDWTHFGLGVVNIRHTGFFLVPGIGLVIGILANGNRPFAQWPQLLMLTLGLAIIFWSGSRGPIMSLSAAIAFSACLFPQFRKPSFLAALCVASCAGMALSMIHLPPDENFGLLRIFMTGTRAGADEVSSGRLVLWEATLRASFSRPLFGYGESQFITVVPEAIAMLHHPHNAVMQILFQWGWVGLAITLALAMRLWSRLLAIAKTPNSPALPIFFAINTMLIYALYDGVFYFIYPMMILTFLIAICLAAAPADQSERPAA